MTPQAPAAQPIGAYQSDTKTGWTAYDAQGFTWPVNAEAAQSLEAARVERLNKKRKTTA